MSTSTLQAGKSRSSLLPREGLTLDVFLSLFRKTIFNPILTLPIFLFLRYTDPGRNVSFDHETAVKRLKYLVVYGFIRKISSTLSWGARNNWVVDKYNWDHEVVLVTGGSGGIGGRVVKGLAQRAKGVKVVVVDIIALTYEAPPNVYFYKCDLTNTSQLSAVAAKIRSQVGTPTVLVNNAGVARGKSILDATEKDIRFTFDVNTLAHYWTVKEFLPDMIKNNHGHVVTVASVAAYVVAAQMTDYAASKAAALAFHEGLGQELRHRYNAPKVRTTLVTQGYTRTDLFTGFKNDSSFLFPSLHTETVADAIIDQILSGDGSHLILPNSYGAITGVRGWPSWTHLNLLKDTKDIMATWAGRQVMDPNSDTALKEHEQNDVGIEDETSKSTVLV